jgi:hypothetical protein
LAQSGGIMPPLPPRSSDVRSKLSPRPSPNKPTQQPPGRGRPGQHRGWR